MNDDVWHPVHFKIRRLADSQIEKTHKNVIEIQSNELFIKHGRIQEDKKKTHEFGDYANLSIITIIRI